MSVEMETVGGLVGYNGGPITSSYSKGAVTAIIENVDRSGGIQVSGGDYAGGLVGYNDTYSPITACYSTGAVSGGGYVGGLIGYNYYEDLGYERVEYWIASSYSTGDVSGDTDVGGLIGGNTGSIISCYSTGHVSGYENVGGLVGENDIGSVGYWGEGLISLSYSTGIVNGNIYTGGLVGRNYGDILSCYSTGAISGADCVGGLVGWNIGGDFANINGSITSCYSIGIVSGTNNVGGLIGMGSHDWGLITSCFWDIETSGQDESDGGIGRTTVEMQDVNTFVNAGWDFVDETANGTDDIWWIDNGLDYPHLWWETY